MEHDEGFVAGNVTDKYGTKNPVARALMQRFLRDVTGLYRRCEPASVVELGCGEGELSAHLYSVRPAEFTCTDLSEKILEEARGRHPHLRFERHSAEDVQMPDNVCDLVLACEVLEHVPDPQKALAEVARLTRKWAILSVPREPLWRGLNMARGAYWGALGNTPGHINHWGRRQFVKLVGSALEVVEVKTPLPWTMVLARLR